MSSRVSLTPSCTVCGKALRKGISFCPTCGTPTKNRRRLQRQHRKQEDRKARETILLVVWLFAGTFVGLLLLATFTPEDIQPLLLASLSFAWQIVIGLVALIYLRPLRWHSRLWKPPKFRWLAIAFPIGALSCAVSYIFVLFLFSQISDVLDSAEELKIPELFHISFFFTIAIGPAFLEEWIYRGILWRTLERVLPPSRILLATSLLFGVAHTLGTPVGIAIPHRILLGLAAGWLRWRSGSLWPAIALHFTHNALAIVILG